MLFLLFSVFTASEFKISHLNALLRFKDPNSAKNPHFTLSAEGGCMKWTSLNTDIVRVKPIYESGQCSKSATVEVVATGPNRKSTSINVVEEKSGQSLDCDVFVDSVASISILTTTRSIYIESSLETLYLQALDSEGNTFTSLEGTDIDWKIDNEHLRIIDPSTAKLTTQASSSRSPFKSSAQLIIQGTNVGKTWASANLDNNLNSRVNLTVVEPIALSPQPIVRVLPYTHIPYKLYSTRGFKNKGETKFYSQIHLPDESNYKIEVSNQNVATTDQKAFVSVNGIGEATVTAIDQHMNDNTASSRIIASYPSRVIQPEQYIALGDNPTFNPKLFDRDNQEYNYFESPKFTIQGNWSTVGRKEVILKYHDFKYIAIVHVCPPLQVKPERAILPKNYKRFPLNISGGSGQYNVKVETSSILNYSSGYIDTFNNYGTCRVIINDAKIPRYSVSAEIEVSRIGLIDINLEYRETIDQKFQPTCEVFATERRKFSVDIPYEFKSSNLNIVSNNMQPNNPGFADIYCACGEDQSEHIKVGVASRLNAEVNGIASPNSRIPLKISGGVSRWPISDEDPEIKVDCPNTNSQVYENNHFSIDREYSGACKLTMQNKQSPLNPHPLLVSANLNLRIHKVDRFVMHFIDPSNQNSVDQRCNYPPNEIIDKKIAQENYNIPLNRQYNIYVYAIDANNDIIRYYSADRFQIQPSVPQDIQQVNRHDDETDFSTKFLITPRQPVKLTINPLNNPNTKKNSIILNTITDFQIKGPNKLYFHSGRSYEYSIDGGSGIFDTNNQYSYTRDSQLFLNVNSPGNYKIDVKDVCNPNYQSYVEVDLISVATLHIDGPSVVAFNTEFEVTVKAFDKNGEPIPQSMYEEAGIHLTNTLAKQLSFNTWRLNSSTNKKLTITAAAENGVSASHVVDVIQSIVVQPQYIELLPGETEKVKVTCGPSKIEFNDGYSKIASSKAINSQTYEIIAISPGNVIINVTAQDIEGLPSFPIYVHVIRPIELKITPSSDHVVQYGKVMLNVVMNTDNGLRFVNNVKWNVQNDFYYDMINNSLIVINCSEPKNLLVSVSAYGLSATYSTTVEPKLKLKSPQEIYLPTQCSYKILIENDLDCQYTSLDSSIVSIDSTRNGFIQSNGKEGDVIVVIKYGHQFLTVNIKVSNPRQFYITQTHSSNLDYKFVVLNPEGYQYTTEKCLRYELSTITKDNNINPIKDIQSESGTFSLTNQAISIDQPILLLAAISNDLIRLKNTFYIGSSNAITPKNPLFLKGYGKQMKCSIKNPIWSVSDSSVASVNDRGFVNARKVGATQLSCGSGISTIIQVLDINGIDIQQQPNYYNNDRYVDYKIDFTLSDSSLMGSHENVIKPDDLSIKCKLDDYSRKRCGEVSYVNKSGEHYCTFTQNENMQCSKGAKLIVTATSPSLGINFESSSQIPLLNGQTNTDSNTDYNSESTKKLRVSLSNDQPTVDVPINMLKDSTMIRSSYGLSAQFTSNGRLTITADNNFGPSGEVVLIDQNTGEKVTITVNGKTPYNYRRSIFKSRQFSFNGNEVYYVTTFLIISGTLFLFAYLL